MKKIKIFFPFSDMDVVIRVCVFQQFTELHIIILSYTMCLCDSAHNKKILMIKFEQVIPTFFFLLLG